MQGKRISIIINMFANVVSVVMIVCLPFIPTYLGGAKHSLLSIALYERHHLVPCTVFVAMRDSIFEVNDHCVSSQSDALLDCLQAVAGSE